MISNLSHYYSTQADVILLDIEGTTTPIDYVFGVLFPFAMAQVERYLQNYAHQPAVQTDLERLWQDYNIDLQNGVAVPEWSGERGMEAVPYIQCLIATDRKSTGLKSLQGKIWQEGYEAGTLKSKLFPDVRPAFERWIQSGKRLFIFSSGSIPAQKLLFQYTEDGDLTPYLSGYFDTETGAKHDAGSYQIIAEAIACSPSRILFISDVTAELKAARSAGMQTLFSLRPGNRTSDSEGFPTITSFDRI